ncbi:MAG: 2-hydroxyglutaryl-CoA dehydratase, partial [Kiritimatiellia bacterium]
KCEPIVPEHHMVMGALGAALLAKRAAPTASRFRGFAVCERAIDTLAFTCGDCANACEVIEIVDRGEIVGRSGGRCRKWEGRAGPR